MITTKSYVPHWNPFLQIIRCLAKDILLLARGTLIFTNFIFVTTNICNCRLHFPLFIQRTPQQPLDLDLHALTLTTYRRYRENRCAFVSAQFSKGGACKSSIISFSAGAFKM
jgi:hypothetical protein